MRDEAPQGPEATTAGHLQDEQNDRTNTPAAWAFAMADDAPSGDAGSDDGDHDAAEGSTSTSTSTEPGSGAPRPRRRRRRGGRGRGRGGAGRANANGAATASGDGASSDGGEGSEVDLDGRGERLPINLVHDGESTTDADGDADAAEDAEGVEGEGAAPKKRRRRRRGGRGRGRGRSGAKAPAGEADAEGSETDGDAAEDAAGEAEAPKAGGRRRSTPKKRAEGEAKEKPARAPRTKKEKPAAESVSPTRTRRSRGRASASDQPTGSTRLSRSRHTRSSSRRREAMPIVPRVTDKVMVITEHGDRDQIAVLEERELVQHYVTRSGAKSMVGNIYMGRVQNVLPGMEAAFVDVGRGRNAVLYAGEVNWAAEDLEGPAQRIEQALKPGQSVLVQVTKDPIGGKGARLTAQVSLPGRFLVLAPTSNVTGISRRLPDAERRRLKAILKKIRPEGHGIIVRTAAEGASEEDLERDVRILVETWDDIEKRSKKVKAPAVLYEEPDLTVRVVRDLFTGEEYRELVTDSPRIHEIVRDYLREVAPDLLEKVHLHEGPLSAFEAYHVVEQIHKGLDRKVWLPSGGYLVIDRTEALTVIDVNTGKSVGKTNLEETVVNTNLEAAREAARQLRLRDIGGMIVIDFIDMLLEQNKRSVIDAMREAMAKDKTRSQVFDISPLGLLEVTRKRVSGGLLESFSETCQACEGRGVLLTYDVK